MSQINEFHAAVIRNLPDNLTARDMQLWIANPSRLRPLLRLAFSGRFNTTLFPTWITIPLGAGPRTSSEFINALEEGGFGPLSDWTKNILIKSTLENRARTVKLVKVSPFELGFVGTPHLGEFYDRAQELGLRLCPPEVGPQLRLQYTNQPKGEGVYMGMTPIRLDKNTKHVFHVTNELHNPMLNGTCYELHHSVHRDDKWVFIQCKSQS